MPVTIGGGLPFCGRELTASEWDLIREVTRDFSSLGLTELARTICELAMKLRDLEDVSSIFVTHEMNNLDYLCSEYAVVDEAGEVVFEKEGEKLCLINSKVLMMRDGQVIFSGTDETLHKADDKYIQKFLRGH